MVVAGHWNFIIVRCLASTYKVMEVTIYKIESTTEHKSQSKNRDTWLSYDSWVYDNAIEAQKFYNRQSKRLKHKDVPWHSVSLSKITFEGTPRQIVSLAYEQKGYKTETLEVLERENK